MPGAPSGGRFESRTFDAYSEAGMLMADAEFVACTFTGIVVPGGTIRSCRFVECSFARCDLALLRLADTVVTGCSFEDCRLRGIDWTRMRWPEHPVAGPNRFVGCDLSESDVTGIDLGSAAFRHCRLRDTSMRGTGLRGADLTGSDAAGLDLTGADLRDARLAGATGLVLDPTAPLRGAVVDPAAAAALLEAIGVVIAGPGDEDGLSGAAPSR